MLPSLPFQLGHSTGRIKFCNHPYAWCEGRGCDSKMHLPAAGCAATPWESVNSVGCSLPFQTTPKHNCTKPSFSMWANALAANPGFKFLIALGEGDRRAWK